MRTILNVGAALVLATSAGCAASSSGAGGSANSSGSVTLDDKANGTTVHVHLGDVITVTLASTYWSFLPTDGLALQPFAPAQTAAGTACPHIPGTGCGSVTATYNVGHIGTSTLKAHRDTCGEALRCVGKDASWSVTIVAT